MRLLLLTDLPAVRLDEVRRWCERVVVGQREHADFGAVLAEADVIVGWLSEDEILRARSLRWLQLGSAGADRYLGLVPQHVTITTASGVFGPAMAEHVLAMMLALARGVDRMLRAQSKRCWDRGPVRCELLGSTALVVGLGDIGTEVAARCKALGMRVLGVRRRVERGGTTAVDTVVGFDGVDAVLPEVDHVVLALPGTPHTARFLDARRIGLLKRGAYVYNVGRGSAIDEAALVDALKEGAIAGAGLDVFEREPLPAESDLWSLDNVVISPHCAGSTEDYGERFAAILVENIQRYLKGEPLRNEVDRFFGY